MHEYLLLVINMPSGQNFTQHSDISKRSFLIFSTWKCLYAFLCRQNVRSSSYSSLFINKMSSLMPVICLCCLIVNRFCAEHSPLRTQIRHVWEFMLSWRMIFLHKNALFWFYVEDFYKLLFAPGQSRKNSDIYSESRIIIRTKQQMPTLGCHAAVHSTIPNESHWHRAHMHSPNLDNLRFSDIPTNLNLFSSYSK